MRLRSPLHVAAAIAFMIFSAVTLTVASAAGGDGELVAITKSGATPFHVEIADTPEQQEHGLMFRETLAPDAGMLFDFGADQDAAFWMKNTPLSLDIIFIRSDGVVMRIAKDTVPFSEVSIPSGHPVRFVLEVPAGTAKRIGLVAGDRIEHPRIMPTPN